MADIDISDLMVKHRPIIECGSCGVTLDMEHRHDCPDHPEQVGKFLCRSNGIQIPKIRVANITLDGSTLTIPADELGEFASTIDFDSACTYAITFKTMPINEFAALGEFNGF